MEPPEAQYCQRAIVRRLRLYIKYKTYVQMAIHPKKKTGLKVKQSIDNIE